MAIKHGVSLFRRDISMSDEGSMRMSSGEIKYKLETKPVKFTGASPGLDQLGKYGHGVSPHPPGGQNKKDTPNDPSSKHTSFYEYIKIRSDSGVEIGNSNNNSEKKCSTDTASGPITEDRSPRTKVEEFKKYLIAGKSEDRPVQGNQ
uniref:Uncharacterized protein n=1 Tax=Cacopsylla melanoneura TaxID=428564 RepID=A0A8D8LU67_9HEMI